MKYRLMPECQCWPVWNEAGDTLHPGTLPISASLSERIMRWSDDFHQALPFVTNPEAEFENDAQKEDFLERGKRLAVELQQELGPCHAVELRLVGGGLNFSWTPADQTAPESKVDI